MAVGEILRDLPAQRDGACLGIIVSAGLLALDEMASNGHHVGDLVAFVQWSVYRLPTTHIAGHEFPLLVLKAGDIVNGSTYHVYYDGTRFRIVPPGGVPLPSRFVAQRRLLLNGDPVRPLEYMTPENFWSKYVSSTTGKPQAYTIEGEFLVFGPRPDSTYYAKLFYYRRFDALDGTGDEQWVFNNAVGLYLYGALIEAFALLGNGGEVIKYSALFDDLIDRCHKADKRDRYPRGGLRAMPEFTGP